jgi:hypothetical protein
MLHHDNRNSSGRNRRDWRTELCWLALLSSLPFKYSGNFDAWLYNCAFSASYHFLYNPLGLTLSSSAPSPCIPILLHNTLQQIPNILCSTSISLPSHNVSKNSVRPTPCALCPICLTVGPCFVSCSEGTRWQKCGVCKSSFFYVQGFSC